MTEVGSVPGDVTAPVDLLDHFALNRGAMFLRPADGGPGSMDERRWQKMSFGLAQARDDELLQAERRRRKAAGEFRHEGDARFFDLRLTKFASSGSAMSSAAPQ